MQLPDTLLAAKLPAAAKTVLTALWRHAEGDPAWTAPRVVDVAAAVALDRRYVERLLVLLTARGAIRRETREVNGRRLVGFGLLRSVSPLQPRPAKRPVATGQNGTQGVVKRERTHKLTEADDLLAIARVAGRGDSEKRIADELVRRKVPCSRGEWHHVKVHRRIGVMADEVGITSIGMRAGDVVARWKAVAEIAAKRKASAVIVPDARIEYRDEDEE